MNLQKKFVIKKHRWERRDSQRVFWKFPSFFSSALPCDLCGKTSYVFVSVRVFCGHATSDGWWATKTEGTKEAGESAVAHQTVRKAAIAATNWTNDVSPWFPVHFFISVDSRSSALGPDWNGERLRCGKPRGGYPHHCYFHFAALRIVLKIIWRYQQY